jgi:hypothetical protein
VTYKRFEDVLFHGVNMVDHLVKIMQVVEVVVELLILILLMERHILLVLLFELKVV